MRISDWSSDVCSSDLAGRVIQLVARGGEGLAEAGRAIVGLEMAGEALDELEEVGLGDLGDLDEGGMTKGVKAEPARAEGELGLRSEEHTSELQSLMRISYAVFCLKKKNNQHKNTTYTETNKHTTKTTS